MASLFSGSDYTWIVEGDSTISRMSRGLNVDCFADNYSSMMFCVVSYLFVKCFQGEAQCEQDGAPSEAAYMVL